MKKKSKNEWIEIEDEMPAAGETILFYSCGETYLGFLETIEEQEDPVFYAELSQGYISDVTHWMPLPETPKTK